MASSEGIIFTEAPPFSSSQYRQVVLDFHVTCGRQTRNPDPLDCTWLTWLRSAYPGFKFGNDGRRTIFDFHPPLSVRFSHRSYIRSGANTIRTLLVLIIRTKTEGSITTRRALISVLLRSSGVCVLCYQKSNQVHDLGAHEWPVFKSVFFLKNTFKMNGTASGLFEKTSESNIGPVPARLFRDLLDFRRLHL